MHEELKTSVNKILTYDDGIFRHSVTNKEILQLQELSNDSMVIVGPATTAEGINVLCDERMRFSLRDLNISLETVLDAIKHSVDLDIIVEDAWISSEQANDICLCFVLGDHGPSDNHSPSAPLLNHPVTVNDVVLFLQASMQRHHAFPGSLRNMPVRVKVDLDSAEHFLM